MVGHLLKQSKNWGVGVVAAGIKGTIVGTAGWLLTNTTEFWTGAWVVVANNNSWPGFNQFWLFRPLLWGFKFALFWRNGRRKFGPKPPNWLKPNWLKPNCGSCRENSKHALMIIKHVIEKSKKCWVIKINI